MAGSATLKNHQQSGQSQKSRGRSKNAFHVSFLSVWDENELLVIIKYIIKFRW